MPVVGLVPLVVAVLATQGAFRAQQTGPVASAPTAVQVTPAPATVQATLAPTQTAHAPAAPTPSTATSAPAATVTATGPTAGPTSTTAAAPNATNGVVPSGTVAPTAAATTGAAYIAYTVKPGDTVNFIARTYGVSAASIVQASGLSNPNRLRVGQVLTIPSQPGWLYRVQPGETLDQIAARTGVASDRIASASGLTAASVAPGDVLLIPDQAVAQSK